MVSLLCSCGKKAIYLRRYSGQLFCTQHFIEYFENKVKKVICDRGMFSSGDRVGVALSGGKDSAVTLYLLSRFSEELGIEVIAISIDEGIKGFRENTIAKAKELCELLDIEHHIFSFKDTIGKEVDEFPEPKCTYCGVVRRKILNEAAVKLKVDKLATGHNLDDMAQAILMNYLRGDVERLIRLSRTITTKHFVPKVRPLMEMPEKEVAIFAIVKKLPVSFDTCPYLHSAFRLRIKKIINELERDNPGIKFSILRGYEKIMPWLGDYPLKKLRKCKICGAPTSQDICKVCMIESEIVKYKEIK